MAQDCMAQHESQVLIVTAVICNRLRGCSTMKLKSTSNAILAGLFNNDLQRYDY